MKIRSNLSQQISISKKIKLKIEVEKTEFTRHKYLIQKKQIDAKRCKLNENAFLRVEHISTIRLESQLFSELDN